MVFSLTSRTDQRRSRQSEGSSTEGHHSDSFEIRSLTSFPRRRGPELTDKEYRRFPSLHGLVLLPFEAVKTLKIMLSRRDIPSFSAQLEKAMHKRTRTFFISAVWALSPAVLNAAGSLPETILYDQMNLPVLNAWYSDSTLANPQSIGDSLESTETWSITSLVWRGVYQDNEVGVADDFKVAMWAVSGGLPSIQISNLPGNVTRAPTGTTTSWGWNLFEYTLTLNQPLLLNPGTHVLEVQNQTPSSPKNWAWATGTGDRFLYHESSTWYAGDFGSPQFQVLGTVVPEPSSAWLAVIGMSWACVRRRDRTA